MICHKLTVKQLKPAQSQASHEPCKCYFRSIGNPRKHAFSAEGSSNLQAIKPANQLFFPLHVGLPAFDAMRSPQLMQGDKRVFNLTINPCFVSVLCALGADSDNVCKRGVGRDPESVRSKFFPK